MKISDFIAIFLLICLLSAGIYLLWAYFPIDFYREPIEYRNFSYAPNQVGETKTLQFYPHMRYKDKTITYSIEKVCDEERSKDAREAFRILAGKTILEFNELSGIDSEITIFCSNLPPEPERNKYFVAGEGGPSEIVSSGIFNIINAGKVSLFREDKCELPQVATHEILHALGFDHNSNPESIMYPESECSQNIDESIIEEIDRIYSVPSLQDLAIESVSASGVGKLLNFEITVANFGIREAGNSTLVVQADYEEVDRISVGEMPPGVKRKITVANMRASKIFENVTFIVESAESEMSKENNIARISAGEKV